MLLCIIQHHDCGKLTSRVLQLATAQLCNVHESTTLNRALSLMSLPQVTGSLLDDDAHYTSCAPLTLTAPNGTPFPFAGVRALLRSDAPIEYGLNPPDAIGDPEQAVSAARLANQAVLAARALVVQYYAGDLVSDDDMATGSGRWVCPPAVAAGCAV